MEKVMAYRMKNRNVRNAVGDIRWRNQKAHRSWLHRYIRWETQPDGHILQEDLQDAPFAKVRMTSFVRRAPLSLRGLLVVIPWCQSWLHRCCFRAGLSDSKVDTSLAPMKNWLILMHDRTTTNATELQIPDLQPLIWQMHSFPSLLGERNRNTCIHLG